MACCLDDSLVFCISCMERIDKRPLGGVSVLARTASSALYIIIHIGLGEHIDVLGKQALLNSRCSVLAELFCMYKQDDKSNRNEQIYFIIQNGQLKLRTMSRFIKPRPKPIIGISRNHSLLSSPPRNTNSLLPDPPDIVIPLPLLQRLMYALHISLALLSSRHSSGSSCLLCCDEGFTCTTVLVRSDVLRSDV